MIPSWNRRTWVHGDLADINPFDHRMPAPPRTIVADGLVIDPEAFQRCNPESLELTPARRLPAIFRIEHTKPIKRDVVVIGEKIASPPIEEVVLEELMDGAESYVVIDKIAKKESKPLDEFEEAQDLPWKEAA